MIVREAAEIASTIQFMQRRMFWSKTPFLQSVKENLIESI